MKVSVPSRGLSYLNEIQRNEKIQFISFRPLTGTLLSKLGVNNRENKTERRVSVPSRGLSYLNDEEAWEEEKEETVSVPSRGLSYLNTIRQFSLPKRLFSLVCVANDILMIKEFNVFI